MLNQLYVTKNKIFDKHTKAYNLFYELFGDSTLFSTSSEMWANKRKRLSAAFYKDKMSKMLQKVVGIVNERMTLWKEKYADKSDESIQMSLSQECGNLIVDII